MTKKRSRVLAVFLALMLTMSMMFAMTANAYAVGNGVNVTVRLDTRSYDLKSSMKTIDGTNLDPVVEYNITVPKGSSVLHAIREVTTNNKIDLKTKKVPDYNDPSILHDAITEIGGVGGETNLNKDALLFLPSPSSEPYCVSGWVYGITNPGSLEFMPTVYPAQLQVQEGMKITMHYSVTGPYDLATNNWTTDFSNPDVTMWNLYDELSQLDPSDSMTMLLTTRSIIEDGAYVPENKTGLTAYYFSHNSITQANELIDMLRSCVNELKNI